MRWIGTNKAVDMCESGACRDQFAVVCFVFMMR